jgi:hypothetical protein
MPRTKPFRNEVSGPVVIEQRQFNASCLKRAPRFYAFLNVLGEAAAVVPEVHDPSWGFDRKFNRNATVSATPLYQVSHKLGTRSVIFLGGGARFHAEHVGMDC